MRYERLTLGGDPGDPARIAAQLRALVPSGAAVQAAVAEIIAAVRCGGDEALGAYTRRFDTGGSEAPALRVTEEELDRAVQRLAAPVRAGLELAIANVGEVARAGLTPETVVVALHHHRIILQEVPVAGAGIYGPGGRAPYPSSVVMGVVPARAAGVEEVAVCSPPSRDGDVDPVVLAACRLTGASVVYRMGGAQAIAALAFGTESVRPVDVIAGPGNLHVQEAKRQVFGQVGIDGFAGPSDLMVIADGGVGLEPLALDLLAQAEHGPGTLVIAISSSSELLAELEARIAPAGETGAVACLVTVADFEQALALAQAFAPEHLQLVGEQSEALAPAVTRAGCLFVGAAAGTAFGDYVAGSNHTLPTGGAARFASALSPAHFRRGFSEVRIENAAGELARAGAPIARAEGFELHARSMEARIRDNDRRT